MNKVFRSALVVVILLAVTWKPLTLPARAETDGAITIKVSTTGTNSNDCANRALPTRPACRTIQYAINKAQSGDTILVAQGTYTWAGDPEDINCLNYTLNNSANSPVVCVIAKNLTVRGGFTDSNWDTPSADPALTVIDGQNSHRGVSILSTINNSPAYNGSLTLENFTIKNGFAQGYITNEAWRQDGCGGGLMTNTAFSLRNIVFRDNHAYGTYNAPGGSDGVGGGLCAMMLQLRSATMEKVRFENNATQGGNGSEGGGYGFAGGFYTYYTILTGSYITMTNNTAQGGNAPGDGITSSGSADGLGGGAAFSYSSQVTLSNVYASGNQALGGTAGTAAGNQGGHAFGGAIFGEGATFISITDARIANNLALGGSGYLAGQAGGGGIMATSSPLTLNRVLVLGNTARGGPGTHQRGSPSGGGIHLVNFTANNIYNYITNSIIAANSAETNIGTVNPGGGAGGIWVQGTSLNLSNCTIAGNRMTDDLSFGLAILVFSYGTPNHSNVTLSNCMITDHVDPTPTGSSTQSTIHVFSGNSVTFNNGMWANNSNNTNLENDPPTSGGPGNFYGLNTMQQKTSAGYVAGAAPYYNYRLAAFSQAVNQATTSGECVDFEQDGRPFGNANDFGADEYMPFSLGAIPGDNSGLLDWSQSSYRMAGGVSSYILTITCPGGASAPVGITCGLPTNVGAVTRYNLTGLTNFAAYQITLEAKNASGTTVMSSLATPLIPSNIVNFLPITIRK